MRPFTANCLSRDGRNKEMRSALCLLVVCSFATTAAAQFGNVGSTTRTTTPPADATPKKATNEKTHAGKVAAKNEPAADSDLADALLAAMDTDHDGIVTKVEYRDAMKALAKVHKDKQGNMTVPDKAAAAGADPNATQNADAAAAQGQGVAGAPAGGDARGNEAMGWFTRYDRNGDGRLSESEVPANMRAGLSTADLNGD